MCSVSDVIDMTEEADGDTLTVHRTLPPAGKRPRTAVVPPSTRRSKSAVLHASGTQTFDSQADVRCVVCSQSLFALLDSERHRHVNQCLDTMNRTDNGPVEWPDAVKSEPGRSAADKTAESTINTEQAAQIHAAQSAHHNTLSPVSYQAEPDVFKFSTTSVTSDTVCPSSGVTGLSRCTVCGCDISELKWKSAVVHMNECRVQQQVELDDVVITNATITPVSLSSDAKWHKVVSKRKQSTAQTPAATMKKPRKARVKSEPVTATTTTTASNDVNDVLRPISAAKLNKALYVNRWSKRVMGADYNTAFGKKGTEKSARPTPAYKQLERTGILIDGFHYKSPVGIYYLTHYHSDHYTGLTSKFDGRKLYCSHITARLVDMYFKIKAPVLHPLELHQRHYLDGIYVTLIDANHCPGANLIIFEVPMYMCITDTQQQQTAVKVEPTEIIQEQYSGDSATTSHDVPSELSVKSEPHENGSSSQRNSAALSVVTPHESCIDGYSGECRVWVHCGDFRYHRSMRELFLHDGNMIESTIFPSSYHLPYHSVAYKHLCTHLNRLHVYGVYLDTTYCNSRYNFPPQGDSVGYAVQAVKDVLAKEAEYNHLHGIEDMELHPSKLGAESDSEDAENGSSGSNAVSMDEMNDNEHNEHAADSTEWTHDDVANECATINTGSAQRGVSEHMPDTLSSALLADVNQPKALCTLQTLNQSAQQTSPFHHRPTVQNTFSAPLTARKTRNGDVRLITSSSNNFVGRLFSGVKQSFNQIKHNVSHSATTNASTAWKQLLGGYTQQHKQQHATRTLFLVGTYSVGKEKVFVEIAKQCNLSIYVTADRRRMLSVLELDKHIPTGVHCDIDTLTQQQPNAIPTVHFTTNPLHSRLHVVPLGYINKQNIMKYIDPNNNPRAAKLFFPIKPNKSAKKTSFDSEYRDVKNPLLPYNHIVAFRPTGWVGNKPYTTDFYVNIQNPDTTCDAAYAKATLHVTIHHVPYSEHSTYNELKEFVTVLSQCGLQSIVPTVSPYIANQVIQREMVQLTHRNLPPGAIKAVKNTQHKINFARADNVPT